MATILDVQNMTTEYFTYLGRVRAVDNVSFRVEKNEFVGVAGESACGKSTLAYSILRLLPPNGTVVKGKAELDGRDLLTMSEEQMRAIRWKDLSIIFQQSMNAFNPVVSFKQQMMESILSHEKVTKSEAIERARSLFRRVGLEPNRMNNYPFEFSGGMKQRAMIAMALVCNPKLVIADEPTTALDVTVQAQVLNLLRGLRQEFGLSVVMITHDISVIAETCDRVAIMYAGRIIEQADVKTIFAEPTHPYTKALINSVPSIEKGRKKKVSFIGGTPPNLRKPPAGCRFEPRCPYAKERCKTEDPAPRKVGNSIVACHYAEDIVKIPTEQLWGNVSGGQ
jgi:peptide/nickel transport system ATP-binding protein